VFFGDLYWRSSGLVGSGKIHTRHNDTGPDGANHDWDGIFMMAEGKDLENANIAVEPMAGLRLLDVAPTILETYGVPPFAGIQGKAISMNARGQLSSYVNPACRAEASGASVSLPH
jgi:predicted AlkP superfamily phosphohydrolase/phosphomutase